MVLEDHNMVKMKQFMSTKAKDNYQIIKITIYFQYICQETSYKYFQMMINTNCLQCSGIITKKLIPLHRLTR